ncbi:MAG: MEDS domain-containing protein [Tatlockia sp.]|nr:MEDS domain-containing protein [Tatlockia sp.]
MTDDQEQELRTLKYGDHVCPIYENIDEQIGQRAQFVIQGLNNGNRCFYVAADSSLEKTVQAFSDAGINFKTEQNRGALKILSNKDAYCRDGRIDSELFLDFLAKSEAQAREDGFEGIWLIAEMSCVLGEEIDSLDLIQLEAKINDFLIDKKCVIFCQYSQDIFDLSLIHDILLTHPMTIIDGILSPNPYFQPPNLLLRPEQIATLELKRLKTKWWIQQLREMSGSELGRKTFKQSRTAKNEHFREILDSLFTFVGILTNSGIVLDVNQTTLDMGGLQREDIIGKPFVDTHWWLHSKAEQNQLREILERVNKGEIVHANFSINLFENRIVILDMTFAPIIDTKGRVKEIVVSGSEVTERLEMEKALKESELLFRQLVETIEEVFWVSDASKEKIIYISPGFEKIWGITPETLYADQLLWLKAIHPEDRERVANLYFDLSKSYNITYRIIRTDGTMRWIRARSFEILNENKERYRYVGVAEDITLFRKLEDQFYQAQKMEAVGKLAGGISHDFNNLLAVIKSNSELLKMDDNLLPEQVSILTEIENATNRAADLTRQLLLFSRQKEIELVQVDANNVVKKVAKMLKAILGEHIKIKFKLAKEIQYIHVDLTMIDQILINIIVNARDAMPNGGELIIETFSRFFDEETISQSPGSRVGNFVCISVSDTGSGIPIKILPRIFEPFFTTKDVDKGTGLGLSTVYGLLKQHQGWINVYSEIDRGTTFRIFLPKAENAEALHHPVESPKIEQGNNETILLVEDEPALRAVISKVLMRHGYQIIEAEDAPSALNLWRANRGKIDLLLTDLILPKKINGWELAKMLLDESPQLKVIYMSGYSAEIANKELQLQEGINFLIKPFESWELIKMLHNYLSNETTN